MADKIPCRYCKKEVNIPFGEELEDKRKITYQQGKCPSCGKINMKYLGKKKPEVTSDEAPEVIPEEEEPKDPPEEKEEEEVIEPEVQELITEEEEAEEPEDKKDKPLPIALIICVSIIIIMVIINLWLVSKYMEYQKSKEGQHGDKES